MSDLAERTGLSTTAVYYRLRHGWTPEEILLVPPHRARHVKGVSELVEVDGRKIPIAEFAAMCGILPGTVRDKLRQGLTVEDIRKRPDQRG